ncbi:MAG: stage II sporulation protein M [Thaumarchaeota archaeon]|nr:stage II sporulation protein M [Nitrososphaerota archaeon]
MNYCPNCGQQFERQTNFCRNCGFNLQARSLTATPKPFFTQLGDVFLVRGFKVILILLVAQVISLIVISSLPYFSGEQAFYSQWVQQESAQFSSLSLFGEFTGIFTNNLDVALRMMIPGLGDLVFGGAIYNTSRLLEATAFSRGLQPADLSVTLALLPHTWIELSAYALAVFEGAYIVYAIVPRRGRKRPVTLRFLGAEVVVAVVLLALILLVAAVLEVSLVVLGAYGLLGWVPLSAIAFVIFTVRRRFIRKGSTPHLPPGL